MCNELHLTRLLPFECEMNQSTTLELVSLQTETDTDSEDIFLEQEKRKLNVFACFTVLVFLFFNIYIQAFDDSYTEPWFQYSMTPAKIKMIEGSCEDNKVDDDL